MIRPLRKRNVSRTPNEPRGGPSSNRRAILALAAAAALPAAITWAAIAGGHGQGRTPAPAAAVVATTPRPAPFVIMPQEPASVFPRDPLGGRVGPDPGIAALQRQIERDRMLADNAAFAAQAQADRDRLDAELAQNERDRQDAYNQQQADQRMRRLQAQIDRDTTRWPQ